MVDNFIKKFRTVNSKYLCIILVISHIYEISTRNSKMYPHYLYFIPILLKVIINNIGITSLHLHIYYFQPSIPGVCRPSCAVSTSTTCLVLYLTVGKRTIQRSLRLHGIQLSGTGPGFLSGSSVLEPQNIWN